MTYSRFRWVAYALPTLDLPRVGWTSLDATSAIGAATASLKSLINEFTCSNRAKKLGLRYHYSLGEVVVHSAAIAVLDNAGLDSEVAAIQTHGPVSLETFAEIGLVQTASLELVGLPVVSDEIPTFEVSTNRGKIGVRSSTSFRDLSYPDARIFMHELRKRISGYELQ